MSGLFASKAGNLISQEQFEKLDSFCYKVENELTSLIRSLEKKREKGDWIDHMVKEEGAKYGEMEQWSNGRMEGWSTTRQNSTHVLSFSNTPTLPVRLG